MALALSYEYFALESVGNFAVLHRHLLDGDGSGCGVRLWQRRRGASSHVARYGLPVLRGSWRAPIETFAGLLQKTSLGENFLPVRSRDYHRFGCARYQREFNSIRRQRACVRTSNKSAGAGLDALRFRAADSWAAAICGRPPLFFARPTRPVTSHQKPQITLLVIAFARVLLQFGALILSN